MAAAVAGLATVPAAALVASQVTFGTSLDATTRTVVPGWAELQLPAGKYTLYAETVGDTDDATAVADAVSGLSCRLSSPSARPVAVGSPVASRAYAVGGTSGTSVFTFRTTEAGRHRLTCDYAEQSGPSVVLAAHRSTTPWAVVAAVALAGAALAGGVAGVVVRRRQRRPAATRRTAPEPA